MPPGRDTCPASRNCSRRPNSKPSEHHDAWLRAKAETENVRRRAQEDIAKAGKFAVEKLRRRTAGGQGQPGSGAGQPRTRMRETLQRRRRTDSQAAGRRLRKIQP
ncbi:MAG: nucleotide exchange factor GrpE [Nitrosomonas sp.]